MKSKWLSSRDIVALIVCVTAIALPMWAAGPDKAVSVITNVFLIASFAPWIGLAIIGAALAYVVIAELLKKGKRR